MAEVGASDGWLGDVLTLATLMSAADGLPEGDFELRRVHVDLL